MTVFRVTLTLLVFLISTKLFTYAAGSLKFTKMNMISALYYYIMFFNLIGASLIFVGFRDHYLIRKLASEETIDKTYYALAYCVITFPVVLIVMKKIMGLFIRKREIHTFVQDSIHYNGNMTGIQTAVLLLMVVCTMATIYVFVNLGYIPIVSMFTGGNLDVLRQSGNRNFAGNQYIKNLLMSSLTPFVSYIAYIYYRTTKKGLWGVMFAYMALLSVIVLTYDFAKTPIITYLLGIYLMEVVLGNVTSNKRFKKLVFSAILLLLFFYVIVFGAGNSLFSIYTGPIGRIIFTQIATLFLHMEAFPLHHPFLNGGSFNGWMSFVFPAAANIRSGRVVMTIFNPQGIEANTAGVMNTVFIGEAYANFGIMGIIIAPIVFGIIIGFFAYLLPGLKKTPFSVLFYVQLSLLYISIVEGGFVDIFYSASIVFYLLLTILLYVISGNCNMMRITKLQRNNLDFWGIRKD